MQEMLSQRNQLASSFLQEPEAPDVNFIVRPKLCPFEISRESPIKLALTNYDLLTLRA